MTTDFATETPARRNAPIISDLGNLCSDLDRFKLPAAVGNLTADAFAFWNASFCERMALNPDELAQVKLSALLRFDEKYTDLTQGKAQTDHRVGSLPCAVKRSASVGREEEVNRMRKFFHDLLSSKILVASFLAHSVHDKLSRRQASEIDDTDKVTILLDQVIDAIVHGFGRAP